MRPLVVADEAYDRDYASDGLSRFGAYVRQRAHLFVFDWEPLSPAGFASEVWAIAGSPVMSPGYVRVRHDVSGIYCRCADDSFGLVVDVHLRLPWPVEPGWASWQRLSDPDEDGQTLVAPDEDLLAVLATATVQVPVAEELLPEPGRFAGHDLTIAKRAVGVICRQVNTHAGPVVDRIRSDAMAARP
jgi:hypothetical protein